MQVQALLKGIIKPNTSDEVLEYVTIGIINKNIGTVSNDRGYFEIEIPKKNYFDSLQISIVDYVFQTYLIKDYKRLATRGNIKAIIGTTASIGAIDILKMHCFV